MRLPVLVVVLAVAASGCGNGDGGEENEAVPAAGSGAEVVVTVTSEPDPPAAGQPVTWSLRVRNDGAEPVTLTFPSGKRGDVVLEAEGNEVYRWSDERVFTEAVTQQELAPGQEVEYPLEEPSLGVEPGDYDLIATLAAEPQVEPDRQRVQIS
ncbi:MAG: BsuPI-related putative proteinase inhibitor [Acidimicrobiia bacterium]